MRLKGLITSIEALETPPQNCRHSSIQPVTAAERGGIQNAKALSAVPLLVDQSCAFEIRQVFGNRLLRTWRMRAVSSLTESGSVGESSQDGAARRIGQGHECSAENIHNHMVVDIHLLVKPPDAGGEVGTS